MFFIKHSQQVPVTQHLQVKSCYIYLIMQSAHLFFWPISVSYYFSISFMVSAFFQCPRSIIIIFHYLIRNNIVNILKRKMMLLPVTKQIFKYSLRYNASQSNNKKVWIHVASVMYLECDWLLTTSRELFSTSMQSPLVQQNKWGQKDRHDKPHSISTFHNYVTHQSGQLRILFIGTALKLANE